MVGLPILKEYLFVVKLFTHMKKLLAVLALPVVMLLGVVAMPTPAVEAQNFASPNPYTAPQDGGSTDNV